jgi:hypothetical protein
MFRYLTLVSKKNLSYSNLLEAPNDMIDIYYRYLKQRGLFDYIDDIISTPHKERGIILKVKLIDWGNVNHIISGLKRKT